MIPEDITQRIKSLVDNNLCTGCGTCIGVCPTKALEIEMTHGGIFIPNITSNKCQGCNLCTEVCPAGNENFEELNQFVFNKIPDNNFIGNFINCYKGYSTNRGIRWSATSGGIITSLLLFLLNKQLIDGALLTRINKDNPLKAEPFIARTETDILSAMGSKYVPVPLNQLLDKIISEDGKFAVVGLPCHIQGIRRAELTIPLLRNKISYRLGITCSHTLNYHGIDYILDKIGVPKDSVIKLEYRGNGWPSGIRVSLKDGQQKLLPNQNSLWSEIFGGYFFTPFCCTVCTDHLNEFSDITFADAWLPEIVSKDKIGTSILITRTHLGEHLINTAVSNDKIEVFNLEPNDVIQSQLWPLFFKKRNIKSRLRLLKIFGKRVPKYLEQNEERFLIPTLWDYMVAPIPYINIFISKNIFLKYLLEHIPLNVLAFYRRIFKQLLLHNANKTIRKN